jgi:hypothetical protein
MKKLFLASVFAFIALFSVQSVSAQYSLIEYWESGPALQFGSSDVQVASFDEYQRCIPPFYQDDYCSFNMFLFGEIMATRHYTTELAFDHTLAAYHGQGYLTYDFPAEWADYGYSSISFSFSICVDDINPFTGEHYMEQVYFEVYEGGSIPYYNLRPGINYCH